VPQRVEPNAEVHHLVDTPSDIAPSSAETNAWRAERGVVGVGAIQISFIRPDYDPGPVAVVWDPIGGVYYTVCPYVAGSLRVFVGGIELGGGAVQGFGALAAGAAGVINVAKAQLGKGYVLGTEGPNTFDCSGLVYYCFAQTGQLALVGGSRRLAKGYRNWFQAQSRYTTSRAVGMVPGNLVIYGDGDHIAKNRREWLRVTG